MNVHPGGSLRMIMPRKPTKPEPDTDADAPTKVTVSIARSLLEELDRYAATDGRSRSNAVAWLLARALADARKAG